MKPDSIRKFDLFYLGSLAISTIAFVVGYDSVVAQIADESATRGLAFGAGLAIGAYAIGMAISLLLWWLTSAKRLTIAKWLIVLFFVLGLLGLPSTLAGGVTLLEGVGLLSVVAQFAAIWFLFQPDARAWFSGTEPADPQTFD